VLLAAGCGSSHDTVNTLPPGDPAPVVTQTITSDNPDRPVPGPVQGASDGAPLGTDPAYNAVEVQPTSFSSSSASRAVRRLDPGENYAITSATITPASITNPDLVDFNAGSSSLQFDEGTSVNLWIKYETVANETFHWTWTSTVTGYTTSEDHTETQAGEHMAYMTMLLPLDDTSDQDKIAVFTCTFADKTGSVVVIPPARNTVSIDFLIKNVPVTPIVYPPITGGAYMLWEDMLANSDYDYNDLVAGINAKESRRQSDGKVVQVGLVIKAIARGASYNSDWQFNMDSAFPGAVCIAYIQQYAYNGTPKGNVRVWHSTDGVSIPVFVSNKTDALPAPPESFATNTVPNSTWVNGDYSAVTIVFDQPLTLGTYTPIPYKPQLRVQASPTNVYTIGLWERRGDPVDHDGRPLGFIIPGNFAWPCEYRTIWTGYPRFNTWVNWVNTPSQPESSQPKWWLDNPVYTTSGVPNVYRPSLFKGNPPQLPIAFPTPQ
jgi:LruC domain-containing protein